MSDTHVVRETGISMVSFMMGAVIGGAVALLYAPRTGDDTRKLLRSKKDEFGELLERKRILVEKLLIESEEKVRDGIRRELSKLDGFLAAL